MGRTAPANRAQDEPYCLKLESDHLAPRYFRGETVYADPRCKVGIGDYVVVVLSGGLAIGRLAALEGRSVKLEQLNPPLPVLIGPALAIHKIVCAGDPG